MLRKYLYGCLLMGMGFSASLTAEPVPFSGILLGGDLGFSNGGVAYTETLKTVRPEDSGITSKTKINTSGVLGALTLGYGRTFSNKFYLGCAVHVGLSGLKGNYTTEGNLIENAFNLKMTNFFGAQVHPGFVVGKEIPTLLHAIVGFDSANWKVKTLSAMRQNTASNGVSEGKSLSKRLTGFTYGVGANVMLSPGLAVGLKVTHTDYKKFQIQHEKASPHVLTYSLKPTENRAMITMTKFFNS